MKLTCIADIHGIHGVFHGVDPRRHRVSCPSKVLFPAQSFVVLRELVRQRCYAACFLAMRKFRACAGNLTTQMFHVGFRDLYQIKIKAACKIFLACVLLLDVITLWHKVQPSLLVMLWPISSRSQTDREQSTWLSTWYDMLHSRKPRISQHQDKIRYDAMVVNGIYFINVTSGTDIKMSMKTGCWGWKLKREPASCRRTHQINPGWKLMTQLTPIKVGQAPSQTNT